MNAKSSIDCASFLGDLVVNFFLKYGFNESFNSEQTIAYTSPRLFRLGLLFKLIGVNKPVAASVG